MTPLRREIRAPKLTVLSSFSGRMTYLYRKGEIPMREVLWAKGPF